jgi:hypothetical protein
MLSLVLALALAQQPAALGKVFQLGHVDGGTLPAPILGGIVYDTLTPQVLVSDGGQWAPLASGGGGGSARSWLSATFLCRQTSVGGGCIPGGGGLTPPDHFPFMVVEGSAGSDITLDIATSYTTQNNVASVGRFTLAGGKTYRMLVTCAYAFFSGNNGSYQYAWFNANTGAPISSGGYVNSPQWNADNSSGSMTVEGVVTTSGSTRVEVRITAQGGFAALGADSTHTDGGAISLYPHAFIEVL